LSGGWKTRSEVRPPPFSLSAWTFDGGRRTLIDIETSEQWPFQGAETHRPRSFVKKASSIIREEAHRDDPLAPLDF